MTLAVDMTVRRGDFTAEARFEAEPGEPVALIGPNGSGKSTVAHAIAGLVPLAGGSIALDGRTLDDASTSLPPQSRRVGVVFQDRLLFPGMSARENVAFAARCNGAARRRVRHIADRWLARVGAIECAARRPDQLSGGEAQCVALARALASDPDLLILDEAFGALDASVRPAIRRLVAGVLADFAGPSLVITHDPLEALTLARRVVVMERGRTVQNGTPDELRREPACAYAASFLGLNVLRGTLRAEYGHAAVEVGEGERTLALHPGPTDAMPGPVVAVVPPRAITLSAEQPRGSARNTIVGVVRALHVGETVRVVLDAGVEITAEITPEAMAELRIEPGRKLWASFKATEVSVYAR